MTVEDLIRLYSFDLSSKKLTIDGMDCLEYNNQKINEQQIRALKKENKELSEQSQTDQKDAESVERKRHKLEEYIDKEMNKMKQKQLELEIGVKTLLDNLANTKLVPKKAKQRRTKC